MVKNLNFVNECFIVRVLYINLDLLHLLIWDSGYDVLVESVRYTINVFIPFQKKKKESNSLTRSKPVEKR